MSGTDPIRVASRVRQWAVLGSKANITQFGFQRYLRKGEADKTTGEYLEEGQRLFRLLQEGENVINSGKSRCAQLEAVNALEPIQPSGVKAVLSATEIGQIVETIDAILKGNKPDRQRVEEALENALKASDAYTDFVFNEIDVKEKEYTRRSAIRV